MFAASIAAEVGTPAVIVPPYPGVTAALGLLVTDSVYEYVTTTYQRISQLNAEELQTRFEELEEQARAQLERDGIPRERWVIQRVADCRYLGQGYELRVEAGSGQVDEAWAVKLASQFHDAHEREYSRRFEQSDIEVPNIRVRGIGLIPALQMREVARAGESPAAALRHEREAWFRVDGELRELPTKFYDRALLVAGNHVDGPAVINQYDTTTVIPPGLTAEIDRYGNIVIWIEQRARTAAVGATDAAGAS
jgi:N-methylhydantoinase A/oxoprolinase/acetone carboxylase beta subunit